MEVKKKARAEPKGESFPSYENPNTLPIANVKIREITRYTRLIFAEEYKPHLNLIRSLFLKSLV
jgi:hypothetical protein